MEPARTASSVLMRFGLNRARGAAASICHVLIVGTSARWPATSRTRHPSHSEAASHSLGLSVSSISASLSRTVRTAAQYSSLITASFPSGCPILVRISDFCHHDVMTVDAADTSEPLNLGLLLF